MIESGLTTVKCLAMEMTATCSSLPCSLCVKLDQYKGYCTIAKEEGDNTA